MTSIEQRDVQSVLAGIDDLLPLIAQARPGDRGPAPAARRDGRRARRGRLLQAAAARAVGRPAVRSRRCSTRPSAGMASACGSTGWVSSIIGVHNWHLALFDQQAQEEVWGEDPTVRVSSSYAPMGAGTVVDGGYLVNGAWNWSSGCDHADVGVRRRPGDQGRQAGRLRQLPDPAHRVPHRRRLARRRAAGHRQQHRSSSRTCSCRGTGSCRTSR